MISFSQIKSVYSGKPNKCCCGCAGKHYGAGESAAADRMVRKVVGLLNAPGRSLEYGGNNVATEIEGRLYVAYLTDAAQARAEVK